ncbi:MAG: hypothetical protein R3B06_13985 [Kofleriaceae bacterium]
MLGHAPPRSLVALAVVVVAAATGAARAADLSDGRETACTMTVRTLGPVATVTEVHDLVGDQPTALEARYQFELPPDAAVTDATVTVGTARPIASVAVPADALATPTPDRARLKLAPDAGLVRWLATTEDDALYEARAYPVAQGTRTRLTLTWTAPLAYRDGRLQLEVPARGEGPGLVACRVQLDARAGAGVTALASAFINGTKVAPRGGALAAPGGRPLIVELAPTWAGSGPVAAMRSRAVGPARAVTSIALYVPPRAKAAAFAPPRLLLIVDGSRSLVGPGRAAARDLVDGLVAAVPATTPVQVISFARTSQRLLGDWTPARAARGQIRAALDAVVPAGGTDLPGALNLAGTTIGDLPARVVVITDAVLPTRLRPADLLGAAMMSAQTTTLDVLVPVVPGAPLPSREVLAPLASAFHGQVLAVRTTELAARLPTLPRQLADAPALVDASVTVDGEAMTVELPATIEPGAGVVVHVSHAGPPARQVRVVGQRGADVVAVTAIALPATVDPWQVVAAADGRVARDTAGLDPADVLALARATPTVTLQSALALVDPASPGGGPRIELARTTGAFTRTPPATADVLDPPDPTALAAAAPAATAADDNLPASTYQYLIKYQLWPAVEICYRDALRGQPRWSGTLDVTLEIARGEVHDARFGGTTMPSAFVACVAAAAYQLEVPTYALAGLAETIAVIHKPIVLRAPVADEEPRLDEALDVPAVEPPAPPLP